MDFLVEDVGESRLALGSVKIFEPGGWEIVERLVDATGGLADRGEIFDDTTVATAILDRLLTTPPSCLSTATATE
jgi:hypothetical protein